jgi:ketosteroid isomerase-like protein
VSAEDEVRAANHAFYRAFESLQLERMEASWAHDGQVTCVHPGWPLAVGWAAVRATWQTIFRNTDAIRFRISDERIDVGGELAWIVCVENVGSDGSEGAVLATNVFRRDGGRWRMVHHHGSPLVGTLGEERVVN